VNVELLIATSNGPLTSLSVRRQQQHKQQVDRRSSGALNGFAFSRASKLPSAFVQWLMRQCGIAIPWPMHGLIPSRSDWSITKTSVTHQLQYAKNSRLRGLVMTVSLRHFIGIC
jgi:hypothetical protein